MRLAVLSCLALQGSCAKRGSSSSGSSKSKSKKPNPIVGSRTDKMINCRFWEEPSTKSAGEVNAKAGEMLPSQCWPIKTDCEHGIEVSFTARNFKELCVEPKRSAFQVYVHYESEAWDTDEKRQTSFNLCQEALPADSDAYGDWIFLNGSQNALIEYQADSYDVEAFFKLKWQCFGMASSVWRRHIGNGWETIIQGVDFMQERFKIKLHRIVTKLMLQVTMKDKCLSEPSMSTLRRIEQSKDIDQWVQNVIRLIKQRFSTCKPSLAEDDNAKSIRHMEFKKAQAQNLKQKASSLIEKFEKFSSAPSQDLMEQRLARRAMPVMERRRLKKMTKN